jgi:hypothetical protein
LKPVWNWLIRLCHLSPKNSSNESEPNTILLSKQLRCKSIRILKR